MTNRVEQILVKELKQQLGIEECNYTHTEYSIDKIFDDTYVEFSGTILFSRNEPGFDHVITFKLKSSDYFFADYICVFKTYPNLDVFLHPEV